MENLHLKNLNLEKILKELAKNPKVYLNYVFNQNANNMHPTLYSFKKLPIIDEFEDTIIETLYKITKEKISIIDKIINLIAFEYNNKFKYSVYKRDQITNEKINESILTYLIEHYLLHSLYNESEVKQINNTLNKKYSELPIVQLGAADHSTISHIITILETIDEENSETNIEDLQNEFKDIKATILKHPNMHMLDRICNYILYQINNTSIYSIIKDTVKKTLIALKKIKILNFDDEILN